MKRVIISSCLTGFFIVMLQTAVFSHLSFLSVMPDLLILLVLYVSIENGSVQGMIIGFVCGLFLDSLSMAPLGLHSFIFTLSAFISGKLYGQYNLNNFILPCTAAFAATVFKVCLLYILYFLFGKNIKIYSFFSYTFLAEAGLNTAIAPVIFFLLRLFPAFFDSGRNRKI